METPQNWKNADIRQWLRNSRFRKFEKCLEYVDSFNDLLALTQEDLIGLGVERHAAIPMYRAMQSLKQVEGSFTGISLIPVVSLHIIRIPLCCRLFSFH